MITQRQEQVFQSHHRFKQGWMQQTNKSRKQSRRHPAFKALLKQRWCWSDYYLCWRPSRVSLLHMARVLKLRRWDNNKISWKKPPIKGITRRGLACTITSPCASLSWQETSHQTNGINSPKIVVKYLLRDVTESRKLHLPVEWASIKRPRVCFESHQVSVIPTSLMSVEPCTSMAELDSTPQWSSYYSMAGLRLPEEAHSSQFVAG